MLFRPVLFSALFGLALASCSPAPVDDPFAATGELIALSGGNAGPQAACHTCHGLNGGGDGALVPRIAGMNSGYLVRQLGFYVDGQRRHPQMSWLTGRLDSDERLAVSAYYAAMPVPDAQAAAIPDSSPQCEFADAPTLYHRGAPDRGLASCASCHGADGAGDGPGNPSLAGQGAPYIEEQLRRWRVGERYGDPQNVMHDAAAALREDEITPLAAYIAHGPERSGRREFPAGCP